VFQESKKGLFSCEERKRIMAHKKKKKMKGKREEKDGRSQGRKKRTYNGEWGITVEEVNEEEFPQMIGALLEESAIQEEITQRAIEEKLRICPNCGKFVEDLTCEDCGAETIDVAEIYDRNPEIFKPHFF
jgi:hypothetical protein